MVGSTAASASTHCCPSNAATPAIAKTYLRVGGGGSIRAASRARKKSSACKAQTRESLDKYVKLARGLAGARRRAWARALDAVKVATSLCSDLALEYPHTIFFAGKLIWKRETWWQAHFAQTKPPTRLERRLHWKDFPWAFCDFASVWNGKPGSTYHRRLVPETLSGFPFKM